MSLIIKTIFIFSYNNRQHQFDSFGNPIKQEPGTGGPEFGGNPLAHLSDSVNSLDPLNAMEKSLNDQVILPQNIFY